MSTRPAEPGGAAPVSLRVPGVRAIVGGECASGDLIMEPGPVELGAGSGSDDIRSSATVTVTGETRAIGGEERALPSATIAGPRG